MFTTGQSARCVAQCSICDYEITSKVNLKRKKFEHFLEHISMVNGRCVRCLKCGIAFTSLVRFNVHVSRKACKQDSGFSDYLSEHVNIPDKLLCDPELIQSFSKLKNDFFFSSLDELDEPEMGLVGESTNSVEEKLSTSPILMSESKGVQTEQTESEPIQNLTVRAELRIAEVVTHCIVGAVEVAGPIEKPVEPRPDPVFDSQQSISPMGLPESDSAFGVQRAINRRLLNTKVPDPQSAYIDSLLPVDELYEECYEPIWSLVAPKHSILGNRGFLLPKAKGERQFYRAFSISCYVSHF